MRKLVAGLFVSLDGVTEAPENWNMPYVDAEMMAAIGAQMAAADTLVLGRRTYEGFAAFWPARAGAGDPMADYLNAVPKLVASTTLTETTWTNSSLIEGDVVEALRELKRGPGKDISITGSVSLVRSLLPTGVIDELAVMVHPIVVGAGARLFDGLAGLELSLRGSTSFATGVVSLTYAPAATAAGAAAGDEARRDAS
ncbi:MAG TPA: dihydrofolate reductase family protein [Actinomycetota bacterium]